MWFFVLLVTFRLTDVASTLTGRIRLVNGTTSAEGRLEIYHDGQWGTVCDDGFNWAAAFVVCRQLGYRTGFSLGNSVTDGNGMIWLDDVQCNGTEYSISKCQHLPWGSHNCGHNEDVGVHCLNFEDICAPVNGEWSIWSEWTTCTTCEGSLQRRLRNCNNPISNDGGIFCHGEIVSFDNRVCNSVCGIVLKTKVMFTCFGAFDFCSVLLRMEAPPFRKGLTINRIQSVYRKKFCRTWSSFCGKDNMLHRILEKL